MGRGLNRILIGTLALAVSASGSRVACAGRHDPFLLNLCDQRAAPSGQLNAQVPECSWVRRQPGSGLITEVTPDGAATERFRSLMSELGVVAAPRLVMPADTLGFAGFQISGELGVTGISNRASYWNGVQGVAIENPNAKRPSGSLTTLGAFVRKGIWLGLPAFEFGAGAVNVLESQLVSWQGYAKLAVHEGFHGWPLPSFAVRGAVAYLTGTDQIRMTVTSLDLIASKGFGVRGTFRMELFAGTSFLFINASSGVFDLTPACDAESVRQAGPNTNVGGSCANAQRGTDNDQRANFSFPEQDVITRQRYFAGTKLKFATVFLAASLETVPAGSSRDGKRPNGPRDGSGRQDSLSLSGGFDF